MSYHHLIELTIFQHDDGSFGDKGRYCNDVHFDDSDDFKLRLAQDEEELTATMIRFVEEPDDRTKQARKVILNNQLCICVFVYLHICVFVYLYIC